jgi:hypothetical protein
MQNTTKTIENP